MREAWEKVVRKLRAGMMPPPGKERPSRADADAIASTLETRLDAQTERAAPAPALHRLNRTEYANAIRDLFGMPVDVSGLLPPDDASEGSTTWPRVSAFLRRSSRAIPPRR